MAPKFSMVGHRHGQTQTFPNGPSNPGDLKLSFSTHIFDVPQFRSEGYTKTYWNLIQ